MTRAIIALAALSLGCGAVDSYLDDGDDATTTVYINAAPELRRGFANAIERWEAAGVRHKTAVLVERSGTPALAGEIPDLDGSTCIWQNGKGVCDFVIEDARPYVFLHELGCHAMTRWDGHLDRGLCASHVAPETPIDAAALELVCSFTPCDWFSPEAD